MLFVALMSPSLAATDCIEVWSPEERVALLEALSRRDFEKTSEQISCKSLANWPPDMALPITLLLRRHIPEPGAPEKSWADQELTQLINLFLTAGADPNALDSQGFTPLMLVAALGTGSSADSALVPVLIKAGAHADRQTTSGMTALHFAARGGQQAVVKALIDHGARTDITDHAGEQPKDLAEQNGHGDLARFIRDQSSDR